MHAAKVATIRVTENWLNAEARCACGWKGKSFAYESYEKEYRKEVRAKARAQAEAHVAEVAA